MQHKAPVIGDFCCCVSFPFGFFFELLEHRRISRDKRIYEKSHKCAQITTSKLKENEGEE
jgi:hypothetical protein